MDQFERHCWAPVLSLYKWGTGAHTERSPMTWHWLTSLPTWVPVLWSCGLFSCHASEHAMPSLSAGPFYVLFFLPEMLPAPFHTSPPHSCLSDSCITCGSQQRPVCSIHHPSSVWSMVSAVSLFSEWVNEHLTGASLQDCLPALSLGMGTAFPPRYGVVLGKTLSNLCQFLPREFWWVHNSVRLKIQVMGNMCLGNVGRFRWQLPSKGPQTVIGRYLFPLRTISRYHPDLCHHKSFKSDCLLTLGTIFDLPGR